MNWRKILERRPAAGMKIKIISNDPEYIHPVYTLGEIYTLKENYIKDGRHTQWHNPIDKTHDENWWSTKECEGSGVEERNFEIIEV